VPVGAVVPEQRMAEVARPDSLFTLGLQYYDDGRTVDARWIFEQLARRLPQTSDWHAPSQLMLARTLYRLGDLVAASEAARPLLDDIGEGVLPPGVERRRDRYAPYARSVLAMIAWQNSFRREAVWQAYLVASDDHSPPDLAAQARILAQGMVAHADSAEFRGMDPVVQPFIRESYALNRALGLFHAGQWIAARGTVQALRRSSPTSLFSQEFSALLSEISRAERSELRIAVIAPLSGPDSSAGADLLKGVQFALEQQRSPVIGRPVVRDADTQLEVIAAAQGLANDPTIRAIIGPLTTENTIAAGAVANCAEVPLVSPTATGVGVAGIGPHIFQINTTPESQGRLLARIAIDSLKAQTVATLSSAEPQERAMTDAFAQEVAKRGGEVFIQEWFFPNTTDFRPQLSEIRLASLMSDTAISEDIRRRLSLRIETELDTMSLMREARTIDVLLIASSSERDVINIAAQVPTQKIWARMLGGSVWGNQTVRQEAGEEAEGVIFATSFDPAAASARQFVDAFRLSRRENPSNVVALAYDATSLVIEAVATGARTRQQIRDRIAAVQGRPSAGGQITLDDDGANLEASVKLIRGDAVTSILDWSTLESPSTWGVSAPTPEFDEESLLDGEETAEDQATEDQSQAE